MRRCPPLLAAVVLLGMVQATASRCGVFGTLTAVVYDMNSTVNTVIAFIVVAAVGIFAGWYPAMALASVAFTFGDSNLGIQLAYTALMGLVMLFSVKNNFSTRRLRCSLRKRRQREARQISKRRLFPRWL